jgi:hypothetical protein
MKKYVLSSGTFSTIKAAKREIAKYKRRGMFNPDTKIWEVKRVVYGE